MPKFGAARDVAIESFREITRNRDVCQLFKGLFVAQAAQLYAYERMPAATKEGLNAAFRLKDVDMGTSLRGLYLQFCLVFERFIRDICHATLAKKTEKPLDERLSKANIYHTGVVLTKIYDGKINGIKVDFDGHVERLHGCMASGGPYELNSEAFTFYLGNCTSERVESLFKDIGLPGPFCDALGANPELRKCLQTTKSRETLKLARDRLDQYIESRNEIIHGSGASRTIVGNDIGEATHFFTALVTAISDLARGACL